jgi:PTH1 family peptidyl-tRNA hydrolase
MDLMSHQWGLPLSERRAKAVLRAGCHLEQDIVLAKPRTFMNNSGEGVTYLLTRFAAQPKDLIIIYDEMALPLGKLRIRPSGSDAGHNGISSIIAALGTQSFPRIRVGIGPPALGRGQVSHALTRFTEEEAPIIAQAVSRAVEAVDCLLTENIHVAMNRFN